MPVKDDPKSSVRAADAKALMQKLQLHSPHGSKAVVVINVTQDGSVDYATYGQDVDDCRLIGEWAAGFVFKNVTRAPFQTWWGHDNGGVPAPLTPDELATLTPTQRAWVQEHTHPDARVKSIEDETALAQARYMVHVGELKSLLWINMQQVRDKYHDADLIQPTDDLIADLDADSLDFVNMMMIFEDAFEIEVPDDAMENSKTVGDLASVLWLLRK
jgi:acyl carrier protein